MIWNEGANGRYGFVFNYVSNDDHYVFKVNPVTYYYTVKRKYNGSWYNTIDWRHDAENINSVKNHLKLVQEGSKVELYVNDVKLTEVEVVEHSDGLSVSTLYQY
ncbi:hypothetical protein [Halanaerobaculum tunisiense]